MNGILNIYKPKGITSFDVVRKVRHLCGKEKVGHAGTLDPLATGVLPICIGKATKIIDYVMNESKIYKATLKFGVTTDTYDKEGTVLSTRDASQITAMDLQKTMDKFLGTTSQIPPMYSALKVNGKRLYDLARKGVEVEREPRIINIYSMELISFNTPYAEILVHCSKGTYIRSLCYDMGEDLGCGASMWELQRVKNGIFTLQDSITLEELKVDNISEHLITIEKALEKYDALYLNDHFKRLFVNGVNIQDYRLINTLSPEEKVYRVYSQEDVLLGLGKKNNNTFKIEKLLW